MKYLLIGCIVSLVLGTQISMAQDSIQKNKKDLSYALNDTKWRVFIPLWVPGFRGNFSYGGISLYPENGDQDIRKRLTESEVSIKFYLIGNVRFQYKKFFVEADGFKGILGKDLILAGPDLTLAEGTLEGAILRGVVGYKIFERTNVDRLFKVSLFAYGGIRYYDLQIYSNRLDWINIDPRWAEPIVGIEVPLVIKRWNFSGRSDIGGLFTGDTQSFFVHFDAAYRFSKFFALGLGLTTIDFKFDKEFDHKNLDVEVQLSGPTMTLRFNF